MYDVKNKNKIVCIVITIALAFSIGVNIHFYKQNIMITNKYESMVRITSQLYSINMASSINSEDVANEKNKIIEIFDVEQGKVIKKIQSDAQIEKEVQKYLDEISGIYVKAKAIPNGGYIIRIPFIKSIKAQNQWLKKSKINLVYEVFIILPQDEKPYLLIMDDKYRPFFYNFEADMERLLRQIEFEP